MSRSVVVVSLRAGDWLEPCLESVRDQADQLVVVDNGSAGSEVSEVGRRFGALVVRNRDNQGFAGGANQGIRQATGEVVALLNDDAVAEATWLDADRAGPERPVGRRRDPEGPARRVVRPAPGGRPRSGTPRATPDPWVGS